MIIPYAEDLLPGLTTLLAATLDLPEDHGEVEAILARLLRPPTGRPTVRLVAADPAGMPVGVVFASVRDDDSTVGHLDLVAVAPPARRQGLARGLVGTAEQVLAGYGVREVRIAGNDPCYAWPGIDVRYTPAVCAATALGYARDGTAWNMTVDLSGPVDPGGAEVRLPAAGIILRRAGADDVERLATFAREHFTVGWSWEVRESVLRGDGSVAGCHIALRAGQLLGFAAYGALRPSLFGPMGTVPAARGGGIGEALLRRCLRDQRDAGLATAQIGWAGPVAFYSRTVGARIERVFLLYRKQLGVPGGKTA